MSAQWKGSALVVLVSEEPFSDPATGLKYVDRIWAGRQAEIQGFANDLEEAGIGYQISASPPIFSVSARVPISDPVTEVLDRYEVTTEALDKSVFDHPLVIADSVAYDAALADSAVTYRQRAEEAVAAVDVGPTETFQRVVRHLRSGVTGYQIDFLVLRRFRQIDLSFAFAGGKMNLSDGSFIYSTGQLNLPSNVAFTLPATPSDPSDDFSWGWRLRGQRIELQGNYAEQIVELVFAPWSTLLYANASGNLNW